MTLNDLVLLTCLSLVVTACSQTETPPEQTQTEGKIAVTPNTDISELLSITPIAGQPRQVWWHGSAMGKQVASSVPGPTDTHLEAWLDFGSAEAVAALVADKQSSRAVKLVPAHWIRACSDTQAFYLNNETSIGRARQHIPLSQSCHTGYRWARDAWKGRSLHCIRRRGNSVVGSSG